MEAKKEKKSVRQQLWPSVETPDGAAYAIKAGFWAAVFCSGVTALCALLAAFGIKIIPGIDVWAFVDASIAGAIGYGLWKKSRLAAWAGLIYYVGERGYMIVSTGQIGANPVLGIILVLGFISGVRGTIAWHRFKANEPVQPGVAIA